MNPTGLDAIIEKLGDRMNPILVKETRQALKSRQFSVTFMLSLSVALMVSFGLAAWFGPNIDYESRGADFFGFYNVVLCFAVLVVVPFTAFRSLSAEQEERTFELLSITSLLPGQILLGKLAAAIAQMLIYYSALSPFLAFCFLLKGIDVLSIVFVMFYTFAASVAMSLIGLFLATLTRHRVWQVFLSLVMLVFSLACMWMLGMAGYFTVSYGFGSMVREAEFWIAVAIIASIYLTAVLLIHQVSISMLTFEADNRSTRIRLVLILQFLVALGWCGWAWIVHSGNDQWAMVGMSSVFGVFLALAGVLLSSEPEGVSQRVLRQVPANPLIRIPAILLFPGPASGLALLMVLLFGFCGMILLAEYTAPMVVQNPRPGASYTNMSFFAIVLSCYIFFYAGLGAFMVRMMRFAFTLPSLAGAAMTVILIAMGSAVPNIVAMAWHGYNTYALWQLSDPFSTLYQIPMNANLMNDLYLVALPFAMATFSLLLNLPAMGRALYMYYAAPSALRRKKQAVAAAAQSQS